MSAYGGARKYNEELQAIRAIAIGLVLVSHCASLFLWDSEAWARLGRGFYVGVDLFLCLSGYVITKSFVRSLMAASGDDFWRQTAAFWVRRLYRITPSAWVWILIPFACYSLMRGVSSDDITDIVAAVLHVENIRSWKCAWTPAGHCGSFGYYWSLSLEEQFYLVLPFLFFFFRKKIHIALLVLVLAQVFLPRQLGNVLGAIKTDALLLGVLLALWSDTPSYRIFDPHLTSSRLRFVLPPILIACLVGMARYEPVPFFIGMVAVVSAVIVWLCSYDRGYFIGDSPVRRVMAWVGERSFAIYLIHNFGFWLARILLKLVYPNVQFNGTYTIRFIVAGLGVTLLLSELSFRLIEVPFRRRGAKRSSSVLSQGSRESAVMA